MKVLFFIESLLSGGKERRFLELIKGLGSKADLRFEIILLSEKIDYKLTPEEKAKVHFLKRNLLKDFLLINKFAKIVNDFKPDIIHGWDDVGSIYFSPYCKLKGIPFINSSISAAPQLSRFSKRYIATAFAYPFSTIILTNSLAGLYSFKVPTCKGRYIHNGIDIDRLRTNEKKEDIKKRLNIFTDKVIGMTASFTAMKDYDTYIRAGEIVLQKRRDVTFIAIGDGPNLKQVKESISDLNKKYFLFTGKLLDLVSVVNIFDIGVLSTYYEGISNSIMEYMALGKPVIATNGGGTSELVMDGITGYLIMHKDAVQLAAKMESLLSDSLFAREMGNRGKERITNHFSLRKMVDETYRLYKEVLKIK
jgi:glycosyltransferase involved in cell wall biosynthesis